MIHQEVILLNLLNEPNNSKLVTRKWNIANNQSSLNYDVGNETIYHRGVLKSNLCDYNGAYILVKGNIAISRHHIIQVAFKNCAPFIKCITKIDETTIDDIEI